MKHLLGIEKLARSDMEKILADAAVMKRERGRHATQPLAGQTWALIFSKSSTRTRVSFEVGVAELGGRPMFLSAADIQLGRGEPIKDTARVLGRMVHGAVFRTFAQTDVEEFARYANIPTINALTDEEHPCQILGDILTIEEKRGAMAGKAVTFIGDGACNVANSWIFAAAKLGFELRVAAPNKFWPNVEAIKRTKPTRFDKWLGVPGVTNDAKAVIHYPLGQQIVFTELLKEAARGADVLYTDVWVSMGKEAESSARLKALKGYQINQALVKLARPGALVMHCLPAYRGKEIDDATFEANAQTIFDQAGNRLHAQKAILNWAVSGLA